MSHLKYFSYPGVGLKNWAQYSYSQAVRVGNRIECSGQGGWDPETGVFPDTVREQIEQAFKNVELALKDAGGKGWEQVYRINSYHVPLDEEAIAIMAEQMKKWMPSHQPIWTCVGVAQLAEKEMKVEIEVVAEMS
jgi:enamine deaminase RidA (YjgF/YER057c/UK114 family)